MARTHRDALGSVLGILAFLGGVALLLVVFGMAYDMFHIPPEQALHLQPGKPVDLNTTGPNLVSLVLRVLLLLVMGILGSLVANRGITMYTHARTVVKEPTPPAEG